MSKKIALRYESEHTRFMREWLQDHPEQAAVKLSGRQLWWDRGSKTMDEMRRLKESRVPQKSYVYYDWNK